MSYYCARLLIVCLVDDGKPRKKNACDYPFFLYQADNYDQAFERALEIGKQQEHRYKNHKGQMVRWAFVQVDQIKLLEEPLDGIEVGSLLDVWLQDSPIPYRKRFNPKSKAPLFI